ncbi:MAG: hypothetical protein EOP09_12310 [Proteobacteria bacterium]|nr:MAG: hypothetical protein EOP09_12310 [Pseudomonadota bacterium]
MIKMNRISALTLLSFLGCASVQSTPSEQTAYRDVASLDSDTFEAVSSDETANLPPEWTLAKLDGTFTLYEVPNLQCVQGLMDRVSQGKAKKNLAQNTAAAARAYGLDPVVFLGLIYQESGDFSSKRTSGGTGVTQMTNVAIRDACHALETTDCPHATRMANPAYEEIWKKKANDALSTLYRTERPADFYPWEKYCSHRPANRCSKSCGITPACFNQIKNAIQRDDRVGLNLGALTFLNFMGVAQKHPGSLMQKYRYALKEYNGHAVNKRTYAAKVFSKVELLRKSCPFKAVHP